MKKVTMPVLVVALALMASAPAFAQAAGEDQYGDDPLAETGTIRGTLTDFGRSSVEDLRVGQTVEATYMMSKGPQPAICPPTYEAPPYRYFCRLGRPDTSGTRAGR